MATSKLGMWGAFGVFVVCALYFDCHAGMFAMSGRLFPVKLLLWAAFLGFVTYSLYCSSQENLFRSIGRIAELHWGRQVGTDLYLGLLLSLLIIYLNQGSLLIVCLWLLPTLVFANLATLLYFAIHFDAIVAKFPS